MRNIRTYLLLFFCIVGCACNQIGVSSDAKQNNSQDNKGGVAFIWPPKKYPCTIPFKVLNRGNRTFPWAIESITCNGMARDKRGYMFVVKGTGAIDSRTFSIGAKSVSFVPEERNSATINTAQVAAYLFPGVAAGETFECEFKGLFTGYYDETLFAGFLILND